METSSTTALLWWNTLSPGMQDSLLSIETQEPVLKEGDITSLFKAIKSQRKFYVLSVQGFSDTGIFRKYNVGINDIISIGGYDFIVSSIQGYVLTCTTVNIETEI